MTAIDWVIVAFLVAMAAFGWRQGFVVGALSLAGFLAGAWLGARLAPALLSEGSRSPYAPLFGLFGALLVGGALASGLEGVGWALRSRLRLPGFSALDGALGALLTAGVGLALAWLLGAVALSTPGARELRAEVQRSAVLSRLNEALPPSGPILRALARFDPFPKISGPGAAGLARPEGAAARDPEVRAAAAGTVRVLGSACGLGVEGSGWIAGGGLVVTNAHVVAGQDDTVVQVGGGGPRLDARAVAFDPRNDLAVLAVAGLGGTRLKLAASTPEGARGAVIGYPENGPLSVRAARIGRERSVVSQDAYGRGPVRRRVLPLRGVVRSGNSGGPLVDEDGRVAGTVFAATTDGPAGGYAVPNGETRRALDRAAGGRTVSTGGCTG